MEHVSPHVCCGSFPGKRVGFNSPLIIETRHDSELRAADARPLMFNGQAQVGMWEPSDSGLTNLDSISSGSSVADGYATVLPGDTSWRMISGRHGGLTEVHPSRELSQCHCLHHAFFRISNIIQLPIMSRSKLAQSAYRSAKGRDRHATSQRLELSSRQAGSRIDARSRL